MSKPLVVYKASAGSGKTFTLATEYIQLLIKNPLAYKTILAVTFTNKATEEMKIRILSQLYGISRQLTDSQPYTEVICRALDASPEFVSRQAGIALDHLLHNYSYFRVETIDSFFQSVLRNLARELELTANLRIGLNDTQVAELAVDEMIENLTAHDRVLQWLIEYINDHITDDKGWNIIGQVKSFGKTIFKDFYKENSQTLDQQITQAHFFERYTQKLREIRQAAQDHMRMYADAFQDTLDGEGLSIDDLSYGKGGVAGFFLKLEKGVFDESICGKRVTDCLEDAKKWGKKTTPVYEHVVEVAETMLIPLLRQALDNRSQQYLLYQSAELTLRHLYQLRLLSSIERKVRELNEDANRFLLSDTQQLLHDLISDTDSPFIFEKIGTQLEHVMIDEFQDTSTIQWQNFKLLLQECMSHEGSSNLIVGDVKQSIYRWRSGDWRLLNHIEQQFQHPQELLTIKTLDTNYRSLQTIIRFNNAFFHAAADIEYVQQQDLNDQAAEQLKAAYADVKQQIPATGKEGGYVQVKLLSAEDYQERTLEQLVDTVQRLLNEGVQPRDIAILVRTNASIPVIAKCFMEQMPEVKIVSDEAFRLDASLAVCTLIQALRLLTHPDDQLTKAQLVKTYQCEIKGNAISDDVLFPSQQSLDDLLPQDYVHQMDQLLSLSLYDLAERLYDLFHLEQLEKESAYVCTFFDQLCDFINENTGDIEVFLQEWEENIGKKTIQSDETDGIRLISIHKSKGLEFDNVIIPYCDWQLEKTYGNILWCQPKTAPFDELPLVPIDYSQKGMMGTIYEKDYLAENLQNTVDNLNLLYVAFTRASRHLFVIGKRHAKNTRSALIEMCLPLVAQKMEGATIEGLEDDDADILFEIGSLSLSTKKETTHSENVFLQPSQPELVRIHAYQHPTEYRQSNQSKLFVKGDQEDDVQEGYIQLGSVLHQIFSTIKTVDDVHQAIARLQTEGILYNENITVDKLSDMLHKRLSDPRVADWFSHRWQIFNECTILSVDDEGKLLERRPDRVLTDGKEVIVIDFKFGHPKDEHQQQVQEYLELLREMGHPHVNGYLWYVYKNQIVEVR